jgi:transposase-like protein
LTLKEVPWPMKKSRFTDQQIASALQQAESGTSVEEVCRKMGVSPATFFRWKKVYGGLMPSEVRKLRTVNPLPTATPISLPMVTPGDSVWGLSP